MKPSHYQLCSINVRTGDQEYVIYELHATEGPLTDEAYTREVLEFCFQPRGRETSGPEFEEALQDALDNGLEEFAYDDRMYTDPRVREVTKAEYDVLSEYL